jgi:site-specific DNA-methyltransferase (adenine-specific)
MITPNAVILGDCLDVMKDVETGSIDLICADLPYQVTSRNTWDQIIPFDKLWESYERIIKDNGAIVLTATQPFASQLVMSNLKLFKYEWIWEKSIGTGFLNAKKQPLRKHEQVLVFYKKQPVYNPQFTEGKPYTLTQRSITTNYNDAKITTTVNNGKRYPVSTIKFSHDKAKLHPTQKPLELIKYLISTYSNENDIVLDNTAGSGTVGLASKQLNRKYILIEKEQKYFDIINERLKS